MGRIPSIAAAFLLLLPPLVAQKERIRLEDLSGQGRRINFQGRLDSASWASDGVHLEMKQDGGTVWIHPVTGESREPAAPGSQPAESRPDRPRRSRPDPSRLELDASPDGRFESFVRDGNLILAPDGGEEWQVTTDGGSDCLNGRLDWVYQEEVYGRYNFRGYWWSPDSRYVAFLRLDQTGVRTFTVIDHVPVPLSKLDTDKTVKVETERYPKAGDPNPGARLGLADVAARKVIFADLSAFEPDILIVRVGFAPDGRRVLAQIQNRIQNRLDLVAIDPASGAVTLLLGETSASWVEVIDELRWLADGSFLWMSDRTGFRHVYHHEADGKLRRAVTSGDWSVKTIEHIDEKAGILEFTGTRDGAVNRNVYRIRLDGTDLRRLTDGDGQHTIRWNGDRSLFLDTVSSLATPPEQRLCDASGKVLRRIAGSTIADRESWTWTAPELLSIPARDGHALDAMLIRPADLDTTKKHAIWIDTYSGPDAPSVANRWNPSVWFQFLAQEGIAVLQVNVRSASGRSHRDTSTCYRNFGAQELRDIEDAVAFICRNAWADADRVGITGWSYGGFMTAYGLTHSKVFRLGVAGAGVYDWRLYDTIYTERYMDTPANNPEGYRTSSCLEAAKNLSGHLVIVHGTMDDNVHLQNAIRLVDALQDAGRDFELMLLPRSRHGPHASKAWFLRRLMWRAISTHLGPPR